MNKKGVEPITVVLIILALAGGFFLVKESGFFATFTPNIGPSSLVNTFYYDVATQQLDYECTTQQQCTPYYYCSAGSVCRSAQGNYRCCPYIEVPIEVRYSCVNVTVPEGGNVPGTGKFAAVNGDIYKIFCRDFSSNNQLQQSCSPNQPATFIPNYEIPGVGFFDTVKCGNLQQQFKPSQSLCVGNMLYTTNSEGTELNSVQCGYTCSNGQCIQCQNPSTRCANSSAQTDIEICQGGQWTPLNTQQGNCIGEQQCTQNGNTATCSTSFTNGQQRCLGNQPQTFSGTTQTWTNIGDSCDLPNGCQVSSGVASCQLECNLGYMCGVGFLQNCVATDRDNEIADVGLCLSGSCNSQNNACLPRYTISNKYCQEGKVYTAVSSGNPNDLGGGVMLSNPQNCLNGCEINPSTNQAQCKLAESCQGNLGQSVCLDAQTSAVCSADGQSYVSGPTDCSANGGSCQNGLCQAPLAQCQGSSFCSGVPGNIFSCNSGQPGNITNSCNGLGCYTDSTGVPRCNNQCETLGAFQCQTGNSFKCVRNQTTNQNVYTLENTCGSGCNSGTGQCNVIGTVGSYFCGGVNNQQIFKILQNQGTELIATCGSGGSYCSPLVGYCKYCEQGDLFCSADAREKLKCDNEQTGQISVFASCPAGCSISGTTLYCDSPILSIIGSQNFFDGQSVSLTFNLIGSESLSGLETEGTARLYGTGVNITKTAESGSNGNINFGFGSTIPEGRYNLELRFPEYNIVRNDFRVRISNDYQINIFGSSVALKIHGVQTKVQVTAVDANGNHPSSISVVNVPSGLSVSPFATAVAGRWDLILQGEPGTYDITLKAEGIESPPLSIEIRKPKLEISAQIPSTERTGERQFDVVIKGPKDSTGAIGNIIPSTKTAVITLNGQNTNVNLLDLGSGTFILKHNFASEGTYTIVLEATKTGYDSATQSYSIQISASGNTQLPGGSTSNNTSTSTNTPTNVVNTVSSIPWYAWVIGGIVVIYYLRRKKR